MEQPPKRWGSRISILGIWENQSQFDYALTQGGFKSDSYIEVMNWQAQKAALRLEQTGQITVIVQDNGPIHLSKALNRNGSNGKPRGYFSFSDRSIAPR